MCSSLVDRRVASNFGQPTSICFPRLCNIAQFPKNSAPIPELPRGSIQTHVQHPARYGSNVLHREVEISRCAGQCNPMARIQFHVSKAPTQDHLKMLGNSILENHESTNPQRLERNLQPY